MATNALGLSHPTGGDEFAPHLDIEALADSLEGHVVVPVANVTARDALVAAVSPSAAEPLYVNRADAGAGSRLEVTIDGTNWRTIHADLPDAAVTVTANWSAPAGPELTVRGGRAYLEATVQRNATSSTVALVVPAEYRPNPSRRRPTIVWQGINSGNTPGPIVVITVNQSTGNVDITQQGTSPTWTNGTTFFPFAISWPLD